jgi:hypothetical protein
VGAGIAFMASAEAKARVLPNPTTKYVSTYKDLSTNVPAWVDVATKSPRAARVTFKFIRLSDVIEQSFETQFYTDSATADVVLFLGLEPVLNLRPAHGCQFAKQKKFRSESGAPLQFGRAAAARTQLSVISMISGSPESPLTPTRKAHTLYVYAGDILLERIHDSDSHKGP